MNCLIFDIDGTLTDTEAASTETLYRALLEETGKEYDREQLRHYFGIPAVETIELLGILNGERIVQKWSDAFCALCEREVKLFRGIIPILWHLQRQGVPMGLVTSKNREQYARTFEKLEISHCFRQVVYAELTQKHKPDPEPLDKFFELSGLSKEGAVYIGDTIHDRECAQRAGIRFALAGWGCIQPEGINPDFLLKTPDDILSLI